MKLLPLLLLSQLFWPGLAFADETGDIDYHSTLTPAINTIAGTLSPFAFSFNGKVIYRREQSFSSLQINHTAIKPGKDQHRTFFLQDTKSSFDLNGTTEDGEEVELDHIVLPRIESAIVSGNDLSLQISDDVKTLRIDRETFPVENGTVHWPLSPTRAGLYTLELKANEQTPNALYDLQITQSKKKVLAVEEPAASAKSSASLPSSAPGIGFEAHLTPGYGQFNYSQLPAATGQTTAFKTSASLLQWELLLTHFSTNWLILDGMYFLAPLSDTSPGGETRYIDVGVGAGKAFMVGYSSRIIVEATIRYLDLAGAGTGVGFQNLAGPQVRLSWEYSLTSVSHVRPMIKYGLFDSEGSPLSLSNYRITAGLMYLLHLRTFVDELGLGGEYEHLALDRFNTVSTGDLYKLLLTVAF